MKEKEPEDAPPQDSGSDDDGYSSSTVAEICFGGVLMSKGASVSVQVAGAHGSDRFLVRIREIGLAQAAGAPPGDEAESVLIGGGRAFEVGVHWVDDGGNDEEEWNNTNELGNSSKFCDADGDFDPGIAGVPTDVWQMAYGKIVAPLPVEEEEDGVVSL